MVSNIAATITGNRAAASAYLLVLISKDGNHRSLPPGRYACELIKEDSGQWRFTLFAPACRLAWRCCAVEGLISKRIDAPYTPCNDRRRRRRDDARQGPKVCRLTNDDRADWRQAYALFTGDVAYVWHGSLHGDIVAAGLAVCGLQLRAQIIWAKQHFTLSRGDYHWKHECC